MSPSNADTPGRGLALALLLSFLTLAILPSAAGAALVINEVMACNTRVIHDDDGDYEDWIEIHNTGAETVDLTGYFLSDDPSQPFKWAFPTRTLSPGSHRLVWASGKDKDTHVHTNFKLSSAGDSLLLSAPGGELLDIVWTGPLPADRSAGRAPDGAANWLYLEEETHTDPNPATGYPGFADTLIADQPPGHRVAPFSVALDSPAPGAEIRYTLDGSEPDGDDPLYTAPIPVSATTVLRARGFETGLLPGPILSRSWFFDETRELPVISLVTDPDHLWDEQEGIYVLGNGANPNYPHYGANFWQAWERPAHLEFYEPDGSLAFAQDIGIRIHGGYTRALAQKSLRLIARRGYGAELFEHEVFPGLDIDEFKYLVLRNAGNDWCRAHCRDGLMQGIARPSGVDGQGYRPAVLFINGEYWGIHNLRERLDPDYIEFHEGLGEDEIDMIKEYDFVMAGDELHYEAMIAYIEGADLSNPVVFEVVQGMMDTEDYLAYCALEVLFANYDWPGGNIKSWRPRAAGGIWRWLIYDLDYGWGLWHDPDIDALARALDPAGPGWPNPPRSTLLLRSLMENAEFRRDFINHGCELLSSRFLPDSLHAAVDAATGVIAGEIPTHMARWGYTAAEWAGHVADLHDWAEVRGGHAREHLRNEFGLGDTLRLHLDVDPPQGGRIALSALTVDGPWSGLYHAGNPVSLRAEAAPGYGFVGWDGLPLPPNAEVLVDLTAAAQVTALFTPLAADDASAVINEINYHSPDGHPAGDWVEFHNPGPDDLDLSGWTFKDEEDTHVFTFPQGSTLPGEGFLLLCEEPAAFLALFPTATPLPDPMGFGLSGSGELLRLYDDQGQLYDSLLYDDEAPWPPEADGLGPSLELIHPERDNSLAASWAASAPSHPHGSPGEANSRYDATPAPTPAAGPGLRLAAPHPNPFNPSTSLRFHLPEATEVRLVAHTVDGRRVAAIHAGPLPAGWHERSWNAEGLASGLYLLELRAGDERAVRKALLLK